MIDHIFEEIRAERRRQDEKFGEQNMSMIGCSGDEISNRHREENKKLADALKTINDKPGSASWESILLEEVYEAFAEADPEKQREEMIQVAAVAVKIIEYLERKIHES